MFFNMITNLGLLAGGGSSNDVGTGPGFGLSLAYMLCFIVFPWFTFKQLYKGFARDKGYNYVCFFMQMLMNLGKP